MNRSMVWALVALVGGAMVLGGCGPKADALTLSELVATDLEARWTIKVNLDEDTDETVEKLYYEPGRVYAVTSDKRLLAIDAFSGQYLWSAELGLKHLTATGVTQLGRAVFICLLDEMTILDAVDGRKVARLELKGPPTTTPLVTGPYAYYGTSGGWFQAQGLINVGSTWNKLTHSGVIAGATCDGTRVYFANANGRVYASAVGRRYILWEHQLDGSVVADLKRTSGGLIVVACRDYTLYALNPATGQTAWANTTGEPLETSPMVRDGRIYVAKKAGGLLAVDETNGKTVWDAEGIAAFVASSNLTVFSRDAADNIVGLALSDGAVKYRLDPEDLTLVATNELDGQLIVGSPDGEIALIRERRVSFSDPTVQVDEDADDEVAIE
jgi:outer membrane protein assembly factor BamB